MERQEQLVVEGDADIAPQVRGAQADACLGWQSGGAGEDRQGITKGSGVSPPARERER